MENKMKKLIFLLFVFFIGEVFSQVDSPNSYTTNYGLRKYANKARPSADSLNANSDLIDAIVKARQDTIDNNVGKLWKDNIWSGKNTFSDTLEISGGITFTGSGGFVGKTTNETISGNKTNSGVQIFSNEIIRSTEVISTMTDAYNVAGGNFFSIQDAGSGYINSLTGGSVGQMITIIIQESAVWTFVDNAGGGNLQLSGDFAMSMYDTLTLLFISENVWIEIGRSNN